MRADSAAMVELAFIHPTFLWDVENAPGASSLAVGSGPRVPDGFVRHVGVASDFEKLEFNYDDLLERLCC